MDETLAVLAMLPFIGYFFRKVHAWYHKKMGHTCHEKHCDDTHVEHEEHEFSPYHHDDICTEKMTRVSEEDMKYLRGTPAPLKITIPVDIWDSISEEDIVERYGRETVDDARSYLVGKLNWFVNGKAEIMVQGQGRTFIHDYECCEHGWREV
jgi:hypothetical protein